MLDSQRLQVGAIPQTNDVAFLATSCRVLHLKDLCLKLAGTAVHQMHAERSGVGATTRVPAQELGHTFEICGCHQICEFRAFHRGTWPIPQKDSREFAAVRHQAQVAIQLHNGITGQIQQSCRSTQLGVALGFPEAGDNPVLHQLMRPVRDTESQRHETQMAHDVGGGIVQLTALRCKFKLFVIDDDTCYRGKDK